MNRRQLEPALTHIVTALAAVIALTVTVMLPSSYFLSHRTALQAEIAAESKMAGAVISQQITRNPGLWAFENARITGLLAMLGPLKEPERRVVFFGRDQLVAELGDNV